MIEINLNFCDTECPIGKRAKEELLNRRNSAFDAAIDFNYFIDECRETCPFKKVIEEKEQ